MRMDTLRQGSLFLALPLLAVFALLPATEVAAQPDPSTLTINHFSVYLIGDAAPPIGVPLTLVDQFETSDHLLGGLEFFAVPVNKNAEGIPDPFTHLNWWKLTTGIEDPIRRVVVQNQFGDYTLDVFNAEYLLAPSLKNNSGGDPIPDTHDHYKCYEVVGDDVVFGAQIQDQFGFGSEDLFRPAYLCNPAEKILADGTSFPVTKPEEHLVCYWVNPTPTSQPPLVITQDQFGIWPVEVTQRVMLCVPSLKDQVVQTLDGTWGEIKSIYR